MKTLGELAHFADCHLSGDPDIKIAGITHDSRQVTEGSLFIALDGAHVDGHSFIPAAKEKGAAVVVVDLPLLDTRKGRDLTSTLIADIGSIPDFV